MKWDQVGKVEHGISTALIEGGLGNYIARAGILVGQLQHSLRVVC